VKQFFKFTGGKLISYDDSGLYLWVASEPMRQNVRYLRPISSTTGQEGQMHPRSSVIQEKLRP